MTAHADSVVQHQQSALHRIVFEHCQGSVTYEDILRSLRLADRSDPITVIIARKIIDVAKTGQRDPDAIREAVLKDLH
jgi:hypothetical protein